MIKFSDEDIKMWEKAIREAASPEELEGVLKKVWRDGYQCAEAEVTYQLTSKESWNDTTR